ncbi:MAG: hypothetical protein JWQ71_2071 [Pedosphaera sp.]|nr:hypothetical protein [Pedosphaera sp.]
MKVIGRTLIIIAFLAIAYLTFADAISYYTGWGVSRISVLNTSQFKFIRNDKISLGGPGVHSEVKYYKTPEGEEVIFVQSEALKGRGRFIRGGHTVNLDGGYKRITTYEPFVLWIYLLIRLVVLFVLTMLMLAVAGLILKFVFKISGRSLDEGKG